MITDEMIESVKRAAMAQMSYGDELAADTDCINKMTAVDFPALHAALVEARRVQEERDANVAELNRISAHLVCLQRDINAVFPISVGSHAVAAESAAKGGA